MKQWLIGKSLAALFKIGLKNDAPEKVAKAIEQNWDKWVGAKRSEALQRRFETFLDAFVKRVKAELRRDA